MARLTPLYCPRCKGMMCSDDYTPDARGRPPMVTSYERCLRRCEMCGIALANSRSRDPDEITVIYENPLENIPVESRSGASTALLSALNVAHRMDKWRKFGFSTSEDAVTWVVFRQVRALEVVGGVMFELGVELSDITDNAMLLWGSPVPFSHRPARELRSRLIRVCDRLGESPRRRSEPDVVFDLGQAGVVILEVKYLSPNELLCGDLAKFDRYTQNSDAFTDLTGVRETRLYELARNWRIGWELAGNRPFRLVNLVLLDALTDTESRLLGSFQNSLRTSDQRAFGWVDWSIVVAELKSGPAWLRGYVLDKGLIQVGEEDIPFNVH